jgi:hypothetical protein
MRRTIALIGIVALAVAAIPAAAKEKKKKPPLDDIVITKPADKSSPSLKTPAPTGPTPVPYPNTNPPASGRSTR